MTTVAALQERIGQINIANGWREGDMTTADKQIVMLALIGTEVAEAIEEIRAGRHVTDRYFSDEDSRKPEGVPSELADVVIRALDCADAWGIDLENVIEEKLAYNETRGYRHGGKVA